MPMHEPRERFIYSATLIMLALTVLAAGSATLIAWFSPVRQPLDLTVPPFMFTLFSSLLVALICRPRRVLDIIRIALVAALLALAAPAWFYTIQASLTPGLQLTSTYPPVASLLLALMLMVMIFLPTRPALLVMLLGWLLVALPVIVYLFAHPLEMHSPRGADLLMTYGPVVIMVAELLPVQRGLTGKIQRLVSSQAQMEIMVNRDPLTQIYNRRFCEQVLHDMLQRQIPAGVIMFDMDHFKAINDTYGHPVGDKVLKRVAHSCQELLQKQECLCRWGGEQFLIAVPDIDATGLHALAERLQTTIAQLSIAPVQQISASVGAAMIQHDDSLAGVLERVDRALYRAKQQGGNVVAYDRRHAS